MPREAQTLGAVVASGEQVTSGLSDEQMQRMLDQEHGGMNEVLADIYLITGDENIVHIRATLRDGSVVEERQPYLRGGAPSA